MPSDPITQAIRDSLVTFWAAGAHAARRNKEAPPQAFDREAARLVALMNTRTTSLAAQDGLVEALQPFANLAKGEVADSQDDSAVFILMDGHKRYAAVSMRDLRRAKAVVSAIKGDKA